MVPDNTKLEAQTREDINAKLDAAGWVVHDKKKLNLILHEKQCVAVCELTGQWGLPRLILPMVGDELAGNRSDLPKFSAES